MDPLQQIYRDCNQMCYRSKPSKCFTRKYLKNCVLRSQTIQPEVTTIMHWSNVFQFVVSGGFHGGELCANYAFDHAQPQLRKYKQIYVYICAKTKQYTLIQTTRHKVTSIKAENANGYHGVNQSLVYMLSHTRNTLDIHRCYIGTLTC